MIAYTGQTRTALGQLCVALWDSQSWLVVQCNHPPVMVISLHTVLSHLDKRNIHVRMLFIDYSSAFNTTVPSKLIVKLETLRLNPALCNWVLDFLMGHPQMVNVGNTSTSLLLNTLGPHKGSCPSCTPCSPMTAWPRTPPTQKASWYATPVRWMDYLGKGEMLTNRDVKTNLREISFFWDCLFQLMKPTPSHVVFLFLFTRWSGQLLDCLKMNRLICGLQRAVCWLVYSLL